VRSKRKRAYSLNARKVVRPKYKGRERGRRQLVRERRSKKGMRRKASTKRTTLRRK
jgi:hypothetical protein